MTSCFRFLCALLCLMFKRLDTDLSLINCACHRFESIVLRFLYVILLRRKEFVFGGGTWKNEINHGNMMVYKQAKLFIFYYKHHYDLDRKSSVKFCGQNGLYFNNGKLSITHWDIIFVIGIVTSIILIWFENKSYYLHFKTIE